MTRIERMNTDFFSALQKSRIASPTLYPAKQDNPVNPSNLRHPCSIPAKIAQIPKWHNHCQIPFEQQKFISWERS